MYDRNPDYFDVERWSKMAGAKDPRPEALQSRPLLSIGLILAPILIIFLALGIDRLVG